MTLVLAIFLGYNIKITGNKSKNIQWDHIKLKLLDRK